MARPKAYRRGWRDVSLFLSRGTIPHYYVTLSEAKSLILSETETLRQRAAQGDINMKMEQYNGCDVTNFLLGLSAYR